MEKAFDKAQDYFIRMFINWKWKELPQPAKTIYEKPAANFILSGERVKSIETRHDVHSSHSYCTQGATTDQSKEIK